ncbi:TPA: hypothetical protein N0F65_003755 [Lagenidium giganteum]|uniref:Chromo domain-containing protein n=1 Tax=Lagenidium giganteum TaxID=4803 RepID=A0AAV2YHT2_9STRA|nr:TPA: hypothetical protein N0F65_003755 [Lagenidium giganteum]
MELALNTSVNLAYKRSSFCLVHGWEARTLLDAMIPPKDNSSKEVDAARWRKKAMRHAYDIQLRLVKARAESANDRAKAKLTEREDGEFQAGDKVWLYYALVKEGMARKLAHLWHGPFVVECKVGVSAYKLQIEDADARFFPVVHVSRLKRFVCKVVRPTEQDFDEALLPEDSWEPDADAGEYEVEEIIDDKSERRTRTGRFIKRYLVRWKGYSEPTWVEESDLACGALLYEYDQRRRLERRRYAAQQADEDHL